MSRTFTPDALGAGVGPSVSLWDRILSPHRKASLCNAPKCFLKLYDTPVVYFAFHAMARSVVEGCDGAMSVRVERMYCK